MPEPQGKDPLPDPPQFIEVGLAGPQLTCSVAGVVGFELPENELFVGIDVFRGSVPDISSQDVRPVPYLFGSHSEYAVVRFHRRMRQEPLSLE
jgi:hypothetical protein